MDCFDIYEMSDINKWIFHPELMPEGATHYSLNFNITDSCIDLRYYKVTKAGDFYELIDWEWVKHTNPIANFSYFVENFKVRPVIV